MWTRSTEGDLLPVHIHFIVFLLFIGAEKLVNRIAKRPLMNGAAWYLAAAAILFGIALVRINSAVPAGQGGTHATLMGQLVGNFLIPVGIGIYYARKFSKEKEAAAREAPESTS
jgi:predicted transporter